MEKQTFDFIKNMKLRVNKVHIRYEDDYFNADSPFSFGLVIDVRMTSGIMNAEISMGECQF